MVLDTVLDLSELPSPLVKLGPVILEPCLVTAYTRADAPERTRALPEAPHADTRSRSFRRGRAPGEARSEGPAESGGNCERLLGFLGEASGAVPLSTALKESGSPGTHLGTGLQVPGLRAGRAGGGRAQADGRQGQSGKDTKCRRGGQVTLSPTGPGEGQREPTQWFRNGKDMTESANGWEGVNKARERTG